MTREKLLIYGLPAPALRPGFPWGGDWCGDAEDVLFQARPHRFAFAPRCALAVIGKAYPVREFTDLLRDWMTFASAYPQLPFISTFLVAQRLIASTCALAFLGGGSNGDGERCDLCVALLQIAEQDIAYLIPRIGKSYPNGHLLTDYFVGWFIATLYQDLCDEPIASQQAENLWLTELERQTYDDGGGIEHAVHYHGLATELAVAYLLLKRKGSTEVQTRHAERIRRMLRLQADLAGPDGSAPSIGDAADDPMFPLDGGTGTTPAAMREIYRGLFDRSLQPLAPDHPANERAFWMLSGDRTKSDSSEHSMRLAQYPESGIFVFFDHNETTRCVFRTGPSAATHTLAGHMHADLLSICLVYRNVPIVVDSGTYSYRNALSDSTERQPWREYFAGPHAHSGVVVDGPDPLGPVVGDFRAGSSSAAVQHAMQLDGTRLSLVDARITAPAHYAGLGRGVVHVRNEYLLVYNSIAPGAAPRDLVFPLQLDHLARIRGESGNVISVAAAPSADIPIVFSDELRLVGRYMGCKSPLRGWISHRYGERNPAMQLLFRPEKDKGTSALALGLNPAAPILRIASRRLGNFAHAFQVRGADFCDHILINTGPSDEPISCSGIDFQGRLLWLRVAQSRQAALRAIDIQSCSAPSFGVALRFDAREHELF